MISGKDFPSLVITLWGPDYESKQQNELQKMINDARLTCSKLTEILEASPLYAGDLRKQIAIEIDAQQEVLDRKREQWAKLSKEET